VPVDLSSDYWTLSKWLAVQTDAARHSIVACIDCYQPTRSESSCNLLLNAHLRFYQVVTPIYRDTNLKRLFFSYLTEREVASFDRQLREEMEQVYAGDMAAKRVPSGLIPRIGWLYAAEFVERGIIRLFAETRPTYTGINMNFDESAALWKRFRNQLDSLDLSEADELCLARSARSALVSYSSLFDTAFKVGVN
jgi:heme oxygenase